MECNPEGLSVLGYPILSDYEYEHEQGAAGGKEQGARHGESVQQRTGSGEWGAGFKIGTCCSLRAFRSQNQ